MWCVLNEKQLIKKNYGKGVERMTERFMVDDAGTLIDMMTRETYDYVPDVCTVLNKLNEENEDNKRLIKFAYSDNDRLRNKNERLHKDWDKLWELCKEHFTDEEIIKELER